MGEEPRYSADSELARLNQELLQTVARLQAELARLRVRNGELLHAVTAVQEESETARESQRAALNLMEDAVQAHQAAQREVYERLKAEEALRHREEQLRALFESMNEAFAVQEAIRDDAGEVVDYRFLECNPAFPRHTGLGDPRGHTVHELLPDLEPTWLAQFTQVLRTGEPVRFEAYVSSRERWLNVSASRVGGAKSNRVAVVFTDVTEQKLGEQALRSSEERLRLIVENAVEYAIFSMDMDRRITSWNVGAQRILGYTPEEIIGQRADVIFTPEDNAVEMPAEEQHTAMFKGRAKDERWHVRKDGSRFFGSGVMMLMHDEQGNVVGFVKIFRDHTEQLRAQEDLERSRAVAEAARAEAEAAARAKDQFLAVLSHELRTPLTPVLMALHTLNRRADLPPAVRQAHEMIQRNVQLEVHFIDDMLDITRISRGRLEIFPEPMDLHKVLEHAVEISMPDFEAKQQRFHAELKCTRTECVGDPRRLQQVFWNLLKNASKFTPQGGEISLRSWDERDAVIVEVRDSGIGLQPEAVEKIFRPFEQANATIASSFGGLGLGLAIAKATLDAHGGTIQALSTGANEGTTMRVRLPCKGVGSTC